MKAFDRPTLLFAVLALLAVIGFAVPLRLHKATVSAGERESDSIADSVVARSVVCESIIPSPPRETDNYLAQFGYSFETDDGWSVAERGGCSYYWSNEKYDGDHSAQISGDNTDTLCSWYSHNLELDDLSLADGHHYYFSGRIRTDSLESGAEAYASLDFWGPGYSRSFTSTIVTTNTVGSGECNEWVEAFREIEVPEQAENATVRCWLKGKGQVWFDYLFLGLDIALGLTKTAYPEQVGPGDLVTYTITYSNAGMESAQNVKIREFLDPDTDFVAATPTPVPFTDDEWEVGTLPNGTGSITVIAEVISDTQQYSLTNWVRMESTTYVGDFLPVALTLWTSATVTNPTTLPEILILPPPIENFAPSPGEVSLSHQVHNCGEITTDVTVTVSAPSGWSVEPSVTSIPNLVPGDTESVVVKVSIPPGEPLGTEGDVTWTATASVSGASDSIIDVIQVTDFYNFLPLTVKQYRKPGECSDPHGNPCNDIQDNYEPNNVYCSTTTSLISGISIRAPICLGDPNDYYYVDVDTPGTLEIWLEDLPRDYDLYLYHSSTCTPERLDCVEAKDKSDNPSTDDEYISYDIHESGLGRYYIRVFPWDDGCDAQYTLRARYPHANE